MGTSLVPLGLQDLTLAISATVSSILLKPCAVTNVHRCDFKAHQVKALEKDTNGNNSSTTWPRRSHTCNFCRREFRSAEALGGHMNVHHRASKVHQGLVVAVAD
ncbi:unnamed protein product [Eruca vesicaria subsp. sativa]|uniref:C2H2-type domain-containing protein n=1 Tax=Eruca vesicaria subsp. sativa TaxID=29727 RepID=A0ABC8M8M6_ERUVS|nr:unnamed protein product [Eruca vesicaria subsp. sativa]